MTPLRFQVYSDYLCPWCFNASVRLERVRDEYAGQVELEWRSYLLRPNPNSARDPEQFRAYTRSWLRPAAEPDAGQFRVWESDEGPPSHSVPAHLAAKAARSLSEAAFRRLHGRLLQAYFAENRDISRESVLRELWSEVELPAADFARVSDSAFRDEVLDEHAGALELGVTGVPAVILEGTDAVILGAQPLEVYRRWIDRTLERRQRGET
ncbi:MAG: DsbA family protein [Proteobacteria bacterium]|nr:DsbA family protein [Pseudomonadota bacterium]